METTKPTVVLVHGAWADNSGFDGSIRALSGQGFRAIGALNSLRELRSDAAYVAALLRSIEGPIVMVGHSYGGAVISNAATGNDEGESLIELAQLHEGSLIPDSLRPVQFKDADGADIVDLYIDQEKFRAAFAGDVDADPHGRERNSRPSGRRDDPVAVVGAPTGSHVPAAPTIDVGQPR